MCLGSGSCWQPNQWAVTQGRWNPTSKGSNLGWRGASSSLCLSKYRHARRFFSLLLELLACQKVKALLENTVLLPLSEWKRCCGSACSVGQLFTFPRPTSIQKWKWVLSCLHIVVFFLSYASIWSALHLFLSHNQWVINNYHCYNVAGSVVRRCE